MEETKSYRVIPIAETAGNKGASAVAGEAALSLPQQRPEFKSRYRLAPEVRAVADGVIACCQSGKIFAKALCRESGLLE